MRLRWTDAAQLAKRRVWIDLFEPERDEPFWGWRIVMPGHGVLALGLERTAAACEQATTDALAAFRKEIRATGRVPDPLLDPQWPDLPVHTALESTKGGDP